MIPAWEKANITKRNMPKRFIAILLSCKVVNESGGGDVVVMSC